MTQDFGSLFSSLPTLLEEYGHLFANEEEARKEILRLYNQADGDLDQVKDHLKAWTQSDRPQIHLDENSVESLSMEILDRLSEDYSNQENQDLIARALELWPENITARHYQILLKDIPEWQALIELDQSLEEFKDQHFLASNATYRFAYYRQAFFLASRLMPMGLLAQAEKWLLEVHGTEFEEFYDIPFQLLVLAFLSYQSQYVQELVTNFNAMYEPSIAVNVIYLLDLIRNFRLEEARGLLEEIVREDPVFGDFFISDTWDPIQLQMDTNQMSGPRSKPHHIAAYALFSVIPALVPDRLSFDWLKNYFSENDPKYAKKYAQAQSQQSSIYSEEEMLDYLAQTIFEMEDDDYTYEELMEPAFFKDFLHYHLSTRGLKVFEAGYETIEAVQEASDEELLEIPGVGPATVRDLRDYLAEIKK